MAEELKTLDPGARKVLDTLLFGDTRGAPFAIVDGARAPQLLSKLKLYPGEHACLYRGDLAEDLEQRAPYLIKLRPESPFTDWLLQEQWGRSACVYAISAAETETLRRHFRGFLRVRDPEGKVLYFRWYDPRVLRVYLPTCNAAEIKTVYGPVASFLAESEEGDQAILFDHHRLKITPRTQRLRADDPVMRSR